MDSWSFCCDLVYFPRFDMLYREKIWQPCPWDAFCLVREFSFPWQLIKSGSLISPPGCLTFTLEVAFHYFSSHQPFGTIRSPGQCGRNRNDQKIFPKSPYIQPGLPDGTFLGKLWKAFKWKKLIKLVYSMLIWNICIAAIWYMLWPFGNSVGIWYLFPCFGILTEEKSGNPVFSPF
jgi:hypothetical protein